MEKRKRVEGKRESIPRRESNARGVKLQDRGEDSRSIRISHKNEGDGLIRIPRRELIPTGNSLCKDSHHLLPRKAQI